CASASPRAGTSAHRSNRSTIPPRWDRWSSSSCPRPAPTPTCPATTRRTEAVPMNPDSVGSKSDPVDVAWDSKDAILYALGVGSGTDELQFTTENTQNVAQRVLPTYAVPLGFGGSAIIGKAGTYNPAMLVHGEQAVELYGEIPVEG